MWRKTLIQPIMKLRQLLCKSVSSSIYLKTPSVNDVLNVINSLDLNKSLGHDNLSSYFLRVASTIVAPACVN